MIKEMVNIESHSVEVTMFSFVDGEERQVLATATTPWDENDIVLRFPMGLGFSNQQISDKDFIKSLTYSQVKEQFVSNIPDNLKINLYGLLQLHVSRVIHYHNKGLISIKHIAAFEALLRRFFNTQFDMKGVLADLITKPPLDCLDKYIAEAYDTQQFSEGRFGYVSSIPELKVLDYKYEPHQLDYELDDSSEFILKLAKKHLLGLRKQLVD